MRSLPVALPHFTFRRQPVFGLAAGPGPALLVDFIGAAADFVFQINGNQCDGFLRDSFFTTSNFRGSAKPDLRLRT